MGRAGAFQWPAPIHVTAIAIEESLVSTLLLLQPELFFLQSLLATFKKGGRRDSRKERGGEGLGVKAPGELTAPFELGFLFWGIYSMEMCKDA